MTMAMKKPITVRPRRTASSNREGPAFLSLSSNSEDSWCSGENLVSEDMMEDIETGNDNRVDARPTTRKCLKGIRYSSERLKAEAINKRTITSYLGLLEPPKQLVKRI